MFDIGYGFAATDEDFHGSFHTCMFHSTLILGVSILFLVQHPTSNALPPADPSDTGAADVAKIMYEAKWTVSVGLSTTIFCLSNIAILSRSLDKPGSLKVTSRYLRLAPRLALVVIAMCLPINRSLISIVFLGVLVACMGACADVGVVC